LKVCVSVIEGTIKCVQFEEKLKRKKKEDRIKVKKEGRAKENKERLTATELKTERKIHHK
jgi:hypothetical protein